MAILQANPQQPQLLFSLASRLTIGSAVCFTEGLFSSIMVMLPRNHWLYIVGAILAFVVWLAFWRFSDNDIGADVGDLYFYELTVRVTGLICYFSGINPGVLWYLVTTISVLKIIRIYVWQESETQKYGWGRFGPMTWLHYKNQIRLKQFTKLKKLGLEIAISIIISVIASVIIKQLPDIGRVAISWIVPLMFEFLYGPVQLRGLNVFGRQLLISKQREADDDAEKAEMRKTIEGLRQLQNLEHDDNIAAIAKAYFDTNEAKRAHMVEVALMLAMQYPALQPDEY